MSGTASGSQFPAEVALGRVAARIEAWADRERKLAGALAGGRAPQLPRDGVGLAVRAGSPANSPPGHQQSVEGPQGWTPSGLPAPRTLVLTVPEPAAARAVVDSPPRPEPSTASSGASVVAPPLPLSTDAAGDLDRALSFVPIGEPTPPPGPFDGLFDSLTVAPAPSRPLPPPDRFRVRVARVSRPHRVTKRDYNYFDELDAALAARAERIDRSHP